MSPCLLNLCSCFPLQVGLGCIIVGVSMSSNHAVLPSPDRDVELSAQWCAYVLLFGNQFVYRSHSFNPMGTVCHVQQSYGRGVNDDCAISPCATCFETKFQSEMSIMNCSESVPLGLFAVLNEQGVWSKKARFEFSTTFAALNGSTL